MSEVKELLAMHVRAFNERAWGRASEIYAPDLVVIEPAGTVHGIDAFLGHAQGFTTAFPDSRMEVTTVIESGDQAVMEGVYAGTNTGPLATPQGELPPTGRNWRCPCVRCARSLRGGSRCYESTTIRWRSQDRWVSSPSPRWPV